MKDDIAFRVQSWQRHQSAVEEELNRVNFLRKPLGTVNGHELYTPTKIRVLRAFHANGRVCTVGEVVTVPRVVARDAVAAHKAEYCET
jgi:hypothetical protein